MKDPFPHGSRFSMAFRRSLSSVLIAAALSFSVHAAEEAVWSDAAAEQLPKLGKFQDAKDNKGAIAFINEQLPKAKPGSYDQVMWLQFLAKFHMMDNSYAEAIAPFEKSLEIGVPKNFIKEDDVQWTRFYLAQIYFMNGNAKGIEPAEQTEQFLQALKYIEIYLKNSKYLNSTYTDALQFNAQILYSIAQLTGADKDTPNLDYIRRCLEVSERGMTISVKPKDVLYLLSVACCQMLGQYEKAGEYLELLVSKQPNNKNNWGQLFATYYHLSSDDKNPKKAFSNAIRCVLTLDRAQKYGIMNTQKDNFNKVGIYFNINQFGAATELLDKGLHDGSIEDTQKNWEILAYSYQQIERYDKANAALRDAFKRYPSSGQLVFNMAQNYYAMEKTQDAYREATRALTIGNLDKPHTAHSFTAYLAFELRQFEEAKELAEKAMAFPESESDKNLPKLYQAIKDSIAEREQNRRAIEQQHKAR